MESYNPATMDEPSSHGQKIILRPLYVPKSLPWFDLRVFYVRVGNCQIDESTSEHLTVNHIPLTPDTILEVNGRRSSVYSDYVSSSLRRDRVDKRSEEATSVSTDSIRMTGSVGFEVYNRDCLLLSGVLELCNSNGFTGETKKHNKKWSMNCQSVMSASTSFLKNKQITSAEKKLPVIEVYVAGCFLGAPIILTKTLQLSFLKKHQVKVSLDSIPEDDMADLKKEMASEDALQFSEYQGYKRETDLDINYDDMYTSRIFGRRRWGTFMVQCWSESWCGDWPWCFPWRWSRCWFVGTHLSSHHTKLHAMTHLIKANSFIVSAAVGVAVTYLCFL